MLDSEGLTDVHIYASSDLDEYRIQDLFSKGAPIDGFGVGSRLVGSEIYPVRVSQGLQQLTVEMYENYRVMLEMIE